MIHFKEAGIKDIPLIRELTYAVWPQTYADILTPEQTAYMLNMMYSEASLQHQINTKLHRFIIAFDDDDAVGFASWSFTSGKKICRLHKIYVLQNRQGKGIGKKLINHIIAVTRQAGAAILELNVNRHNKAKDFYIRQGFRVVREEDIAIGNGYFMNDYVMQKSISVQQ
ncbi:GNAT family N-acetyltransferase [Agriterribacter sp.]|uniref:GNAT family N-acetyltransferase n=1 Tax=Agriterribacter sp. TaxID=2821509 RepID=UPI002CCC1EF4|nr:GNAT family N-acetyltransferase [Agriterribacter sp.]HRN57864.1 GNAT family N-acetyltransferase [Agriterribacter sp.]HRO45468.1 GNAT family N-acetyltransferase [Agriterribacter sp.]HRQ18885.1 GNAT family N-acetyltransferase [Agriterribacter sp.]